MSIFDEYKEQLDSIFNNFKINDWVKWIAQNNDWDDDCDKFNSCYFRFDKKPRFPQHFKCKCKLQKIATPIPNVTAFATCDIRKFTEYIFDSTKSNGKTDIFLEWGYKKEDSNTIRQEYLNQALKKYCDGDYIFKGTNSYHAKIEIIIELHNKKGVVQSITTGWVLLPNGEIKLTTPYSGHRY